jgi:hypothetical protein
MTRGEGAGRSKLPDISFREIAHQVIAVYRRHWKFLVPAAMLILLPQAIADGFLDGIEVEDVHSVRDALTLGVIPLTVMVALGGEALYAGLAAAAVVEWRAGHPVPRIGVLIASLPMGRLIADDLILSFGTALGLVLLVIPAILFLTYFGIAPAILKIEHVGIRDSFRRSRQLVRGQALRVATVVVTLVILTELAMQAATYPFHDQGHGLISVIDLAVEGALEPFQGLAIVVVALLLIERRGELPAAEDLALTARAPR